MTRSASPLSSRCGSAARTAYSVPLTFTSIISSRCSLRKLEERAVGADPGVGDEDVETPETVDRLADDPLEVGRVAHVARTRDHVFEPEVVAAAGRQPEADAGGREHLRDRARRSRGSPP